MSLKVSSRLEWVAQSEIRNMSIECERLGGINLSQGVCDLEIPEPVRRGAQQAIDEGYNVYTRYDGLQELREAIAHKHKQFNGLEVDPEGEVIVSAGTTGAFYCACLALLEPGDEVIVFEPYYGYHISTLLATQARPAYVRLHPPGWTFTEEDLEAAVTSRTRGILVNTPANPSGKVFTREELEAIGRFATRHDLFIFTDEIYEYFVYDGRRHVPPAAIEGIGERTITISGLSKTFSITGWRIGYCICDRKWARPIGWFNDLVYVCAPAPLQIGVARGLLQLDAGYYQQIAREYQEKRDRICDALTRAGLDPVVPQGAYYVLADISRLPGDASKDKAMFLLQETGVAAVPGEAFYHDEAGSQLARFCFAKRDQVLDEACRRIARLASRLM
ncbi:aminotransferase [Desulfacinum infernum DSM 9756]|uniref:Aminotransferase n=1 Tax=Desulfacinum infernum DSM 9756 TaxID=1121391 RepID=A0A1M4TA63_9BACT|nr:pyridoxal phosphate-dependent aminotransferase [Desulfacinum infernum]SHE41409.1 aminotransferase [Desulfacinum infernum DSM 9756]